MTKIFYIIIIFKYITVVLMQRHPRLIYISFPWHAYFVITENVWTPCYTGDSWLVVVISKILQIYYVFYLKLVFF